MAERPLYTLYKNLKAQNYDVPDDYNKFESALTRDGKSGADNRHAIYENLKAQNFDVPSTYERFYSALFEPRSRTSSRAKGGSVPMSSADRARYLAVTQSVLNTARQVNRASGNIRKTVERAKKFNANDGKVTIGFKNPLHNQNVQKNEFNYNATTGKTGTYTTTDGVEFDNEYDAAQYQNKLDKQGRQYINAVSAGEIPSVFDVRDKNGNYDLQENIGKNGTYLTEDGAQKQFDKKLADAYARKKEIEALIAEDNRQNGNPLLSYSASIGASNGRTAEQSDYSNKLATSLALVKQQIGALEAVKQYPTSSWGEDALKALDNTAFTAKTWDFGLTDFATMGQMERIKTKMDNNIPLSGSDKMLLKSKLGADAAAALEDEKMGNIYRWTKIAGQSLPFMADFFLTGGYGGITKGISRGALKFAAKRGMGKVSAAILKNTGIVAGDVIGSYAMAGTEQALKTGADIMQRHLGSLYQDEKGDYKFGTFDENGNLLHEGGESMGSALYKGLTSAMVENYTEKLFGHNYGIKKGAVNFMEKHGMNASAEFFKNIGKSGWYTNSKKWMEKFGINGFGEEVMEEEIGIPLHALLDGEGKVSDLLDAKQQLDIIGGMAISVGSMYAMGAGSRPVKGIYNRAQYYRFRNKVNVADNDAQSLLGDNWAGIKDKIDNATNEQMGGVLSDILRQRDTMTKEQINAAVNYGINLMKMRGYNIAKTAEMNAKEIANEPTTPEEQHQADIDNAYSEGHDADDADKHDIQIQHEDQAKTLAAALNISEQQLSGMSDEELESLTGQNDKLDQAIYDYQLSSARYQGVVDDAQDKVDLAAHQAEQRVDMYTDKSRGSVRNATIKASGGAEDYSVYIISGNIATNDDGSIDARNSDDMILYYDPTTNSVEHADALMFAELGEELPADDVKAQAVADAKENAIKEIAGIIDGTVEVGSQFSVTDADGTEHTYEILADNGDGTAMITIDGNVPTELINGENVQIPYSFSDLQQMKDLEDQKRLEAAKAEREQMEKERAAKQNQETEQSQPSFDFNQILNDNGNVVLVDVLGKDGNTKYPDSKLFLIRDTGAKAKVVELKSDGTIVPHAVNKENVATISSMSLDEYKQAFADSSIIEDNSGENRGEIEVESPTIEGETTPEVAENTETTTPADETAETPSTEQTPAITLEDGTIVPMLDDGNPDFSKLTAAQTAELYDNEFGEDAYSIVSGYVSDAKKALEKANNMTVKGKTFVEQKASKDAKEKAIADAQAAYDSAIAIRDAYNERQLAKVEDTAEGRKNLIEKARRKFALLKSAVKDDAEAVAQIYKETVGSLLHRLYDSTGIDVTDTIPLTAEEYVASNLGAHSLNYEGTETSKSVKQETGLSREDFAKTQLLAADGKGTTIDALVHSLWENRPSNLDSLDTQDIRNALIGVLTSGFKASEARSYVENIRIAQAEKLIEEERTAAENAAYYEQQKAKEEEEKKKAELEKKAEEEKSDEKLDNESSNESNDLSNESDNEKKNDNINDNINSLTPEQQKAKEDGEKIGFPAVDKEGEPINQYVIELANWAKEQGLKIDPTSKWNNYADLFIMCKDGFGVGTLVPNRGDSINQVVYFPDNVQGFDQLWKLHEEFNVGRDLKHSADMDNEQTQGVMFYDGDTAREFKEFVDKKVEEQNKVFGEQIPESDLPFSAKENGKQQTTAERASDVEKNKVDDMKVVDNIVGNKTRKAFERLAKMMGANVQWQYSDKLGNGWIQETKDPDGNVHRTIFITLDSSITEGAQFIFGHEMTHQIKNLNPAAYNELTQLVLDTYGSDAFDKAVDETMKRYSDAGFSGRNRDYYAEEVVADAVGEMIRDLNLAHTLAMKMSHPLLAAIHEILQKIKLAFFGTEYSDVTKNIIRSIEQAYVKTANGEVTNSETGEDVSFSLRQKPEPKKKGVGYKVFVLKDGKLYPPMVANPDGAATPVGVWLDADAAPIAGESKTGRPQVKQGGKGTQGGSGKLAYRPGWHLGVVPYAIQFNRKDAEGNKTLFPNNFVFAEVEYAADVDYQDEARQEGINPSGKYQHSLAGLKHLPTDGYYMYRTNPNPETDPWVITGAMKVNRILTRAEQAKLVKNAGREPQQIQEGDIVTDDVVNSINQEIADTPKFSLKVYHGSGADFTEFDFDHMGEGAGSQVFGWGGYVTSSEKIGKSYAEVGQQSAESRHAYSEDTPIEAAVGSILGQDMYNHQAKTFEQKKAQAIKNAENSIASFSDMLKNSNELDEKGKKFLQKSIEKDKKELEVLRTLTEEQYKEEYIKQGRAKNLYEVDIPDDNGRNYLKWYETLSEEQINTIRDALAKKGVDVLSWEKRGFKLYLPFKNVYTAVLPMMMRCEPKEVSKFLSSLGFTGIKYPAGTIQGGAEEGDTNYVIFNPKDMKITEHTKFSIKTYHGSQASFDHFDHSFMGSGEGAQAYGWGTYVSEVEGIAKAYAKSNATIHSDNGYKEALYKYREADFNYHITETSYKNAVKNLKEKEQLAHPKIKNLEKELEEAKSSGDTISVGFLETALKNWNKVLQTARKEVSKYEDTILPNDKDVLEKAKKRMEELMPERNLYSVDIPDDTGRNYIGWDEEYRDKELYSMLDKIGKALESNGIDLDKEYNETASWNDWVERLKDEGEDWKPNVATGQSIYNKLSSMLGENAYQGNQKAASLILKDAGFVGVKVVAQRNTGGNKEGKMNYVIFDENNAKITNHTKFSLKSKPVRFEAGKKLSDEEKKEVLSTLKDAYKVNGVPYHIEETAGGKEKRVYEPTADSYVVSDITNRPLRYYITLPDGRVAHPTEVYPNISDNEVKSSATKQGLLDDEAEQIISTAIGNMKDIADNAKAVEVLTELQNLPHDTHDVGYGMNNAQSYNYKTGIFTSDADQAIDYVVRRMRRKKDVPSEIPAALKKAVADSYGMVDNLIDGISSTKVSQAQSVNNEAPKTFEEFLNHPSLKFSIKNEEQRKAAENAYKYASKLRPNKYAQYAIVDMSMPSKIPEYYEKKVLADNWRRFYNRAVRWGNYKLFDLDRPFADQVNEVKGKVPDKFNTPDNVKNKDNIKGVDKQVSYAAESHYSLKDEKTLAGVHNITEEKLRKALKLGGFANPSLAVIDTNKTGHDNFGEISFIAPSSLLDKRTGKTAGTWITDAYTQRYPSVERQMSEKGIQKFRDWVDSLEYSDADKAEIKRQTEDALSNNNAPAWELMYLKEKGIDIKEYNSKVDYRWKEIISDHPTAEDILNSMKTDPELNEKVTSLAKHAIIHSTWEKVSLDVRRNIYEETGVKVSPINPQVRKQTKEIFERDYAPTLLDKNGNPKAEDIKKVVEDIVNEHNDTKKYDFYLSKVKASNYVNKNGLYNDYIRWQEKKLDEFGTKNRIFRGYKPDGTRKYVHETLENVSKAMREEADGQTNGSEYTSFGSFIAKIASRVDSTDEMRDNKDKLSSNEDKEEFYEKWSEVYYDLAKFLYNDVFYGEQRLHDIVLQSDPKKYAKKEYGITLTPTFMKKLDALKSAVQTELKSAYFETKYNRPLRLNEFAAAVVPDNLGEDVRNGIENAGLPMFDYDPNKEGDRSRAFNEAINSSDNIRFSLRYDQFEHDLNQWKKDNNLPKDAQRPTIPQRNAGESAVDFLRRVDEYRKQMALWKTAPTYEQHLLSNDTALGEFNRELQRGSVLKRIAFQDSMLAIRKAQEVIMKEVGVDRLNMAEDAYTAENRSHGKGKNEFEEYNNEFLQPLRNAYHQMKKVLGDSYDNVRLYMMAKHGLERDAQMAFKKSLDIDYDDVAQRSAAYRSYKGDMNRITNDSDFEFGRVDFNTWRQRDNAIRTKYSPSYMNYRYDKDGTAYDYSGLSALFDGSDFEEAAHKLVRDIESKHIVETKELWDATNAATKKILRDGYKAGMMSEDTYQYVRDMYSHYIPLRGWDGTTADQVWDYVGGGKGAFNQTLKKANGRTSIADDPIAYIENMAESGILLNNKNWVKQHLMLLAQNHPTSLLTLSKAWYVKSTDANGNEEWIPATPQITSQMNSNQVKAAIDAFEQKMEQMEQTGDATQKRDGLNIAYPQTHSEEREHEVRVMKDGEEYVIYVNGDPQLAQAMNNTRAHRVSEGIKNSISKRVIAVVGRKMAAAYTSLSPLFIPSNYFRDLTMTLASTAIREDARYNYLLRKNLATSWNLGFMLRDFQNGKLREKVNNGNATAKEQMFYDFMMNGGETGFVSSLDVEDLKKKFKNELKDLNRLKANPVKVGHTIMDSIEFLNRAIEDSNRFAVYMTSIQYGRSIDEAVNDAKNVTLNFNRKGTGEYGWQMIRNLYLFINPAVQSLQTLGALGKHHPFKFTAVTASWLASGVLVPIVNAALMQMAAAFGGGDGDDDKEWYKDISKKYWKFSKWDRRNNFIMWVPFTHEFIKIPLAQEFRAFYGLGDMIASKMMGGELADESWSQYAEDLLGQVVDMLPLDPTGYDGNIAVSLMPNAIRPVFELAFNVDFTGKPLFKDTEYNKYDPNFTKAYVGTPDWLVRASRMMNSIGNDYPDVQQNKWDAFGNPRFNINNPAVVDHVLSSYLGGAYTMGSQVLGLLTKSLNDPKEIKVADIPLFSKFVSNPDDRPVTKKQGDEFWNMKENHDRAANTLSKLKKQAKVDGDYSMLERFYGSEEYKQYKQDDVKVKKYEEDKKKERAEESGEEYRPHKLNAEDIYKAHATPKDDFEDLKLKQLYAKLNGFKTSYDLLVDTAPSQSDGYYNANKAAIDAIDEISIDKQEISELKKGFLYDGKDAYNSEDMKQIRELRKKVLAVLEKANKVVVANQKAKKK